MVPSLNVSIRNEWGTLKCAIMHDGSNVIDLTVEDHIQMSGSDIVDRHPETGSVCRVSLMRQHAAYCELVDRHGVEIVQPINQHWAFDQVFTRDPGFVIGQSFFSARMRDEHRLTELIGLEQLQMRMRCLNSISNGTLEGGDVIVLSNDVVLVGLGEITNSEGIDSLEEQVDHEVLRIPHDGLHLDCCFAPLPNGAALVAADRLPDGSLHILDRIFSELIHVPAEEAILGLATNLLWLNPETVVSTTTSPKTNELLRSRKYDVLEMEYSQPIAFWGSVRCTLCPLYRE